VSKPKCPCGTSEVMKVVAESEMIHLWRGRDEVEIALEQSSP